MAETKTQPKTPKAKIARRTPADLLAQGNKGIITFMVQRSFSLSKANKFEGTSLKEYTPSSVNGVLYSLTKVDGKVSKLSETSEAYKNLLAKAKAAKAELEADTYGATVKAFIDAAVSAASESAARVSGSILKGVSFN